MSRITQEQLEILVDRINKTANTPMTYCTKQSDGKTQINVGHYHLDSAYGGYKLAQTVNNLGGIRAITESGYTTKKNLYYEMIAFLNGLEVNREGK